MSNKWNNNGDSYSRAREKAERNGLSSREAHKLAEKAKKDAIRAAKREAKAALKAERSALRRAAEANRPRGVRGFVARMLGPKAEQREAQRQEQKRFEMAQKRRLAAFEARHPNRLGNAQPAPATPIDTMAGLADRLNVPSRFANITPASAEPVNGMTVEQPKLGQITIRPEDSARRRAARAAHDKITEQRDQAAVEKLVSETQKPKKQRKR